MNWFTVISRTRTNYTAVGANRIIHIASHRIAGSRDVSAASGRIERPRVSAACARGARPVRPVHQLVQRRLL